MRNQAVQRALIGFTGFVGGNLCKQGEFYHRYNSQNIETIQGEKFDEVVCAGMPAAKWLANQRPQEDLAVLKRLEHFLGTIETRVFTLVSTVDVFHEAAGVDESVPPDLIKAHPYGLHRAMLEDFVKEKFADHLVVRLPGLFGPGLKKNVIYDLMHQNQVENINPESRYQYYDLKHLTADMVRARSGELKLIHLTSAPIKTRVIAERFFPHVKLMEKAAAPAVYDFRTRHANLWNVKGAYQYSEGAVLQDLEQFLGETEACS